MRPFSAFEGKVIMRFLLILILGAISLYAQAEKSALNQFIGSAFPSGTPDAEMLWLNNQQRQQATDVLGHRFSSLRVRYWRNNGRSAWVMDEIGKERPITIGVVVTDNDIEQVKILEYRESRGGEVRYPFFTRQFIGVGLEQPNRASSAPKPKLNDSIDGISGATLSVRAVKKVATLALLFHSYLDPGLNEQVVIEQQAAQK